MKDAPQDPGARPEGHEGQSRRSFLARSLAVAGAAGLASAAASGAAPRKIRPTVNAGGMRPPRADEPIRVAVIGTGGMGGGHCQAMMNFKRSGRMDVQVVALADVCQERLDGAQRVCESRQDMKVFATRDYREVLARDDFHGVIVASPEHWHAQHSIDALHAGKDVYCEKPMTLRLDEGMALRKVVLAHPDAIFQVGTQMMMLPKYREARAAIKEGRIGTPVWSQTSYCRNSKNGEWLYYGINPEWKPGVNLDWDAWLGNLGPRPWNPEIYARWRRYRDFSTGIIGDLLVHVLTPLVYSLDAGWPVHVLGTGAHAVDKAMENHDQVNITARFESGHTMVIAGSTANEVGLETMIRGHEANIYLNGRHCEIRPERIYADVSDAETRTCPDIGNDQDMLRLNWLECIRSREPAESNVDLASKVMVIVDLATRSMWDGRAYRFDPKTLRAEPA